MANYDFFDLTGLPFDPPEKSAKKINAAIDKKVKELESVLSCETQLVKRDELTNQIKLLNDTRAAILEPNEQSILNALAENKVILELEKLLSTIGLMIEADISVLSESTIKYHHKKSGLSCVRIRDEFERLGFTIKQEKVFDIRELFPKNIKRLCEDLVLLNKLLQSNSCDSNTMFVDDLYSLIAYLMDLPENKLAYKELSTEELRGMVTVLFKTVCSRFDNIGKIAASLVAYAKVYVFDSDEHRNAYDLYLRYSDAKFQSILLAMKEAHVSVLLDKRFAEMCISHFESVVGDYDTATAMYNSICMLKDTPYPLFAKSKSEEDEINNLKLEDRLIGQAGNNKHYYGIDLGATYSVISTLNDNGIPEVIANNDEGSNTLASAVYFQEGGDPVVGEVAKEQKEIEPERVIELVKRHLGQPDASAYEFDGITYDPITISALIVKRMIQYASEQGHDVKDVVITCPAWFGIQEKSAIRNAAIIAGLNVINVINESTASVLSYCYSGLENNSKILVYDLGGAYFDVTLSEYKIDENGKGTINIVNIDGNDRLGGIDWDARMYDYMCEQYEFENGISQYDMDIELQQIIKAKAERIKKELSNLQKKNCAILYEGDKTRIEITREQFESRTQDLVEQSMTIVKQLLDRTGLSTDDVDVVLLVGGSTRMPMIRNAVEAMFPGRVRFDDPDLAVAKGAALAAAIDSDMLLFPPVTSPTPPDIIIDYWPQAPVLEKSIGIKVLSNGEMMVKNLLYKGTELPQEATFMLNTAIDNQESIKIELYANSSTDEEICMDVLNGDENTSASISSICEVSIALCPKTPALTPIELRLRYDGELAVSAVNLLTSDTFETVILLPVEEK